MTAPKPSHPPGTPEPDGSPGAIITKGKGIPPGAYLKNGVLYLPRGMRPSPTCPYIQESLTKAAPVFTTPVMPVMKGPPKPRKRKPKPKSTDGT